MRAPSRHRQRTRPVGVAALHFDASLVDANNNTIATGSLRFSPPTHDGGVLIPSAITSGLTPGAYTLKPAIRGITCVPQPLIIGAGLQKPPFRFILYGDYGMNYVNGTLSQERDLVANQAVALKKLAVNMVVDPRAIPPAATWAGRIKLTEAG